MNRTGVDQPETLLVRWVRLSSSQKLTVAHVVLVASVVEVAIRVASVARVARWLGIPLLLSDEKGHPERLRRPNLSSKELRRARFTMRVMEHWPFAEGTCLRQSLVVGHFLRRHDPALRLGVKRDDGRVRAHAWIEIGETTLGFDDSFVPFRSG